MAKRSTGRSWTPGPGTRSNNSLPRHDHHSHGHGSAPRNLSNHDGGANDQPTAAPSITQPGASTHKRQKHVDHSQTSAPQSKNSPQPRMGRNISRNRPSSPHLLLRSKTSRRSHRLRQRIKNRIPSAPRLLRSKTIHRSPTRPTAKARAAVKRSPTRRKTKATTVLKDLHREGLDSRQEDFSQRMGWPRLSVAVFSQRLLADPHLPANFRRLCSLPPERFGVEMICSFCGAFSCPFSPFSETQISSVQFWGGRQREGTAMECSP
jgi:hypothetical protein